MTDDNAKALRLLRDHVMTLLEYRTSKRDLDFSESTINSLPGIFYLFNQSGQFLYWTRRFEELSGYSHDAFSRLHPLDLVPGEDRQRMEMHINQAFESGASEVEASIVANDGTRRPHYLTARRLVLEGEPNLVGTGIDISLLRETEQALRKSEERYRTLVEGARDAIVTVGTDGTITSVNEAFEFITEWESEAWLSRHFDGLLHPDDVAPAREALAKLVLGERMPGFEVRVRQKGGGNVPVEITASLFEEMGEEQAAIIVARDIRQRKAMDEQLRRMQKLDAIGQLAAGVAHDFNNLLMVMQGEADLLQMDEELPAKARESARQIVETAMRGQQITRELLLLSREQPFRPAALSLHEMVTGFTSILERLLYDEHSVQFRFGSEIPLVSADQGMLEQVLMNLVINARDAMPDGGSITITTEQATLGWSEAARHPDATPGEYVCLCVTDTGVGIDAEQLTQIFEPLFTTKPAGKGTGLGCAMPTTLGWRNRARMCGRAKRNIMWVWWVKCLK